MINNTNSLISLIWQLISCFLWIMSSPTAAIFMQMQRSHNLEQFYACTVHAPHYHTCVFLSEVWRHSFSKCHMEYVAVILGTLYLHYYIYLDGAFFFCQKQLVIWEHWENCHFYYPVWEFFDMWTGKVGDQPTLWEKDDHWAISAPLFLKIQYVSRVYVDYRLISNHFTLRTQHRKESEHSWLLRCSSYF